MRPLFADTFFYLALLNANDAQHTAARSILQLRWGRTVTTGFVLTEVANGFSAITRRSTAVTLLQQLRGNARVTIVPATQELFDRGVDLYSRRLDKGWSLTDCTSFIVMQSMGLTEALTGDRHFQQAGFRILL